MMLTGWGVNKLFKQIRLRKPHEYATVKEEQGAADGVTGYRPVFGDLRTNATALETNTTCKNIHETVPERLR